MFTPYLKRSETTRSYPGGTAHYMAYVVYLGEDEKSYLDVPCRSKLHHVLTGLFYNWSWQDVRSVNIDIETAHILKYVFSSQKKYPLWGRIMAVIQKDGKEAGLALLKDRMKVLAMTRVVTGHAT